MSAVTIQESRRLQLPLETVLEALVHFDRRSNGPLSRGDVMQADFVTDNRNGDAIEVAVRMPDSSDIEWRRFDFGAIAAAIISYCRAKRIPLPLSGVKSIELTKEGVMFSIENQVNIAQRPEVRADIAGRPLRYAKGYEPHSIVPSGDKVAYA
ncbi:MAG TPA: hypothetical protein VFS58_16915 [Steroidobacteraceae bacterium]|nr:hypothetical protein [Steroidobacteraceae bacterium]